MHTFPLSEYVTFVRDGDWNGVATLMSESCARVAATGAEFAICPDNTIHRAFDRAANLSPIPWLHIAEEVAKVAFEREHRKLGILGTKYLMEGSVYVEKLDPLGIRHETPSAEDREKVNEIIMEELVYGKFLPESRAYFCNLIEQFKGSGCDAVVLGCTEIPLLVSQDDSALPILDSTRILARAAIATACDGSC